MSSRIYGSMYRGSIVQAATPMHLIIMLLATILVQMLMTGPRREEEEEALGKHAAVTQAE